MYEGCSEVCGRAAGESPKLLWMEDLVFDCSPSQSPCNEPLQSFADCRQKCDEAVGPGAGPVSLARFGQHNQQGSPEGLGVPAMLCTRLVQVGEVSVKGWPGQLEDFVWDVVQAWGGAFGLKNGSSGFVRGNFRERKVCCVGCCWVYWNILSAGRLL